MNPSHSTLEPEAAALPPALSDSISAACRRLPPLWPLSHFVAVNPFLGLSDRSFLDAAKLVRAAGHGDILMPGEFYRAQIAAGRIQEADVRVARELLGAMMPPGEADVAGISDVAGLREALAEAGAEGGAGRWLTFADFLDDRGSGGWGAFVVEEISKWCSAYYDQGQSAWRMPWRDRELFPAWKAAARLDANPELMGLKGFRGFVDQLPDSAEALIGLALRRLGVGPGQRVDFLHRQLMTISGWSGHVQWLVRGGNHAADSLAQLLAIRLAYDLALRARFGGDAGTVAAWRQTLSRQEASVLADDLRVRMLAQQALECAYQRELIGRLKTSQSGAASDAGRKSLQAVFCIDVRSEVFRRCLEAQSERIQTVGFAGFFGLPIEYRRLGQPEADAYCPVLLKPGLRVRESARQGGQTAEARRMRALALRRRAGGAWNAFKTSAISCFSFVEAAGLAYGFRLVKDSLALRAPETGFATERSACACGPKLEPDETGSGEGRLKPGIPLPARISLAAGALKNMGLAADFARVVMLCGHGSATVNNPYGSALDCGACGGHAGDANARLLAEMLNQPAVRHGLADLGITIPADTLFVAALHNTTTDEILIYDTEQTTAGQSAVLEEIRCWLRAASTQARRERAASLGLAGTPERRWHRKIRVRSRDWSEVRPEWGLAGNAAFIAAPRALTKGLNLGGRVFLHDYESRLDADRSVLTLILTAPVVVASWINLQYYASTVNNRLYGSGNKVLHNVVGTFGVWEGNGGDLRPGLPLQSLADGAGRMHEPLRLSVFIAANPVDIQAVLQAQPAVRELVENGWIHMFALDESGRNCWRCRGGGFVVESPD